MYGEIEIKQWYEFYKTNPSTRKTATNFGVSRPTVKRLFKKFGFEIKKSARKYFFNEDFFSVDTPESFYWAGFIAADAGICGSGSVVINLSIKDYSHLEKFKKALNHDGSIIIYDERPIRNSIVAKFLACSVKMVNDLKRFNISLVKSLTYVFPEWMVSHSLVNHFIRGYNDGDGCVYRCSPKYKNQMGFSIVGTEQCLSQIRKVFSVSCKTNDKLKIMPNGKIYQILYNGRINLIKIREFLYRDSYRDIELDRKKILAASIEDSHYRMPIISTDLFGGDLKFYESQMAAEKDGLSSSKICCCIKGTRKKHRDRLFRLATKEEIQQFSDNK
jgi:hypothetical protein